jgi:hypothetical protein
MTYEEKLAWLQAHLANCLGEELPVIQGSYTFEPYTIPNDCVLAEETSVIVHGRIIKTYDLTFFMSKCENIEILTKESFAIMCTNDPLLNSWYQWNLSRGRIPL